MICRKDHLDVHVPGDVVMMVYLRDGVTPIVQYTVHLRSNNAGVGREEDNK